ncbi:RcnB family protein [Comamonas flocculans]|nr:RcnB family protein [Comamonas flocculans]
MPAEKSTASLKPEAGMQRRALITGCVIAAIALAAGKVEAQPRHDRHDRRGHGRPAPHRPPRGPAVRHHGNAYRRWRRGERLPSQYRSRHYVVNNWRAHRLSRPPRGYHWVQYGADYVLVAIATGVIAQVILNQ